MAGWNSTPKERMPVTNIITLDSHSMLCVGLWLANTGCSYIDNSLKAALGRVRQNMVPSSPGCQRTHNTANCWDWVFAHRHRCCWEHPHKHSQGSIAARGVGEKRDTERVYATVSQLDLCLMVWSRLPRCYFYGTKEMPPCPQLSKIYKMGAKVYRTTITGQQGCSAYYFN